MTLSDILAMARQLDILAEDTIGVFSRFNAAGVISTRGKKMARGDLSATFELTTARKDMRLMLEAGAGQPLVVLPAVAQRMDEAIAAGQGKDDLVAIGVRRGAGN